MSQGKGMASSTNRGSSGGRPRLDSSFSSVGSLSSGPFSAPSSSFDASIPFNLPPRRSMKMLKDGSDFVWPEAAHSLFVRGLQAWKVLNIGSKRTRAPRGEGKTDFLVRFLESHGVQRTKKQVASHLAYGSWQVLRTEWRNSDNTVLLSLVDDTVPHTRSLSEPSFPPPSQSDRPPTDSLSLSNSDDRSLSTPSLPSPMDTLSSPSSSSSLYHPAQDLYNSRPRESVPNHAFRTEPGVDPGPWQPHEPVWHTAVASQSEPYSQSMPHYPVPSYDSSSTFHDHDRTPRPAPPLSLEPHGYSSDYYLVPGRGDVQSSSVATSLARPLQTRPSLALDVGGSPYNTFSVSPSYPALQRPPQLQDVPSNTRTTLDTMPYQLYSGGNAASRAEINVSSVSSYGDAVEPAFFSTAHVQQPQPQHWVRLPATMLPRQSHGPKRRRDGSPRH